MKRIVIGLMLVCGPLILEASTAHQLTGSTSSVFKEGAFEGDDGVSVSKDDAPEKDVVRDEIMLSSSPRQILARGVNSIVKLFATPPPLAQYGQEEIEETSAMYQRVLANDRIEVDRILRKVGPACAERPIVAGLAPVHMASFAEDRISLLKLFMEAGVNIKARTQDGRTPLQIALRCGNVPVTETLLSGDADIGIEETSILENLSAEESVVKALTVLLGQAKRDRLVTQVIGTREKFEADKKKKLDAEEKSRQELGRQARTFEKKQREAQEQELQTAGHVFHDETEDAEQEDDENLLQDNLSDAEADVQQQDGNDGQDDE